MKESWKLTNSLFNKPSRSTNITNIKDGNTEIKEKREISNIVNSYFVVADFEKDFHDCSSVLTSLSVHDTTLTTEKDGVNRLPYLLKDMTDRLLS